MKLAKKFPVLALLLCFLALSALAQDSQKSYTPSGVYNLKFVVSELDNGKVINQRTYSVIVREEHKAQLKTGNRVPIATGSSMPGTGAVSTQFQYLDIGFNADTSVSEREGRLDVMIDADMSNMVPADPSFPTPGSNPIIRSVRQHVDTSLVEGKPTIVTNIDDVGSKKTVQLEVTVTRIRKT